MSKKYRIINTGKETPLNITSSNLFQVAEEPDLDPFVPYVGATKDVDLGIFNIKAREIEATEIIKIDNSNHYYHIDGKDSLVQFLMNDPDAERTTDTVHDIGNIRGYVSHWGVGAICGYIIDPSNYQIYVENTDGRTTVEFETPVSDNTIKYPAKEAGTYTLATVEDLDSVDLQKVLDNGGEAGGFYGTYFGMVLGTESNSGSWFQSTIVGTDSSRYTDITQNYGDLQLTNRFGDNQSLINIEEEQLSLERRNVSGKTTVQFEDPIADTVLQFPAKTVGTYTIATLEEVKEGFVPYTGATKDVDLGTHNMFAANLAYKNEANVFTEEQTIDFGTLNRTVKLTDDGLYLSRTSTGSYSSYITGYDNDRLQINSRSKIDLKSNGVNILTVGPFGLGIFDDNPLQALDVTGNGLFTGWLNANSFIKEGATDNDILLGDGTTTELDALATDIELTEVIDTEVIRANEYAIRQKTIYSDYTVVGEDANTYFYIDSVVPIKITVNAVLLVPNFFARFENLNDVEVSFAGAGLEMVTSTNDPVKLIGNVINQNDIADVRMIGSTGRLRLRGDLTPQQSIIEFVERVTEAGGTIDSPTCLLAVDEDASIQLIPTGYIEGIVPSILPYLQRIMGDELVINGTFDYDGDWILATGWTISGGVLNVNATAYTLAYPLPQNLIIGEDYICTLDVVLTSGVLRVRSGGTIHKDITESGSYEVQFTSGGNYLNFQSDPDFVGTIDNVSCKQIVAVDPTTVGDFTFTRASGAYRTNEDGVLEWMEANVPRIDHSDPGCPKLLLEGESTNIALWSEVFNSWTKRGLSSVTSDSIIAPDGNLTGNRLTEDTGTSTHRVVQVLEVTVGLTYTLSVWAKPDERTELFLQLAYDNFDNVKSYFDLENKTTTEGQITEYPNGWLLCSITGECISSGTNEHFINIIIDGGSTYTGDGVSGLYLWGGQIKTGSLSSYIPTSGTPATRAAETCLDSGNVDSFNSEEGALYFEGGFSDNVTSNKTISIKGTDGFMYLQFVTATSRLNVRYAKTGDADIYLSTTNAGFTFNNKYLVTYKQNNLSIYVDGVLNATDLNINSWTPNSINNLSFFKEGVLDYFYGKTKDLRVFKYAPTDEEIIELMAYDTFVGMAWSLGYYEPIQVASDLQINPLNN